MNKRVRISSVFIAVFFVGGLALVLYPFISNELNNYLDNQLITFYQQQANQQNAKELAEAKQKWQAKNEQLLKEANSQKIGSDPFSEKESEKKVNEKSYLEKHTIAFIDIPKINVSLPIFNGTNDLLLEKGAGLLEGTSYPIGGAGTHSVITGHRGLISAKLFTDLPNLKKEDTFVIMIAKEKHAYKIDQIRVVEPDDTELLRVVDGKDYVTLLTCTPFMVNSHRLLVRGHRVPYTEKIENDLKKSTKNQIRSGYILLSVLILIILIIYLFIRKKRKSQKKNEEFST
ncbi:class C sortase [Enterococcus ureasiticus]|uniref:Class C sortase n=1 Tax=Enterococcus ureasiticus TaxID=903984 RepID=A0A1E5GFB9_9ENTE|nr:class C sortase [Enterococcus ureasiticus]OEG11275.1 class C sortase [Enterococcus ureasiticus]